MVSIFKNGFSLKQTQFPFQSFLILSDDFSGSDVIILTCALNQLSFLFKCILICNSIIGLSFTNTDRTIQRQQAANRCWLTLSVMTTAKRIWCCFSFRLNQILKQPTLKHSRCAIARALACEICKEMQIEFTMCWRYFPKDCHSRAIPTEINTGVKIYCCREWWYEPLDTLQFTLWLSSSQSTHAHRCHIIFTVNLSLTRV